MNRGNITNIILKLFPFLVGFAFILFLIYRVGSSFLAIHDSPFYLTLIEAKKDFGFYWNQNSFGYTNYLAQAVSFPAHIFSYSFYLLGFSTTQTQLIFYLISLVSIWYSALFFFNKIYFLWGGKSNITASLLSSSLYLFNLYMVSSWHGGLTDTNFVLYIINPAIFYLSQKIIINNKSYSWLWLGVAFGSVIYSGPFALAILLAISISLIIFRSLKLQPLSHTNIMYFFVGMIPVGAFSLISLFLSIYFSDPHPLVNSLNQFKFSDTGLSGYFRFFFEWTINQYWHGKFFHPYYPFYASGIIIFLSFVLWTPVWVVLSGFKKKGILFLLLMLVISLFLAKGIKPPFAAVNQFMYKFVPLFNIFRTPDTKFGLAIITTIALLVGFAYLSTTNKFYKLLLSIAVVAHSLVFLSSIPITEINNSENFDRIINTPDGYKQIVTIVNEDKREGYIFVYPGDGFLNFNFRDGDGFTGQDLLGKLILRPVIYSDGFIFGDSKKLYDRLLTNSAISDFGSMGIRYIFIRKDSDDFNSSKVYSEIKNNPQISLVSENSIGDLYQVRGESYQPIIRLDKNSPGEIDYRQISPSKYEVTVRSFSNPVNLYFLQSYHPGWKISIKSEHYEAFDFANGWYIYNEPNNKGKLIFTLYFAPQQYYWPLFGISAFSFFGLLAYLTINHRQRV